MIKNSAVSTFLFKRQEFLVFIGLYCWLAIFHLLEVEKYNWSNYLITFLLLTAIQSPVLFLVWFRDKMISNGSKYLLLWIACFLLGLPLLTIFACLLPLKNYEFTFFTTAAAVSLLLELLLMGNRYYQNRVQHKKWVKKIGLENAVFISIVLLSIVISIMAVSSLEIPAYDKKDQLLIGFEVDLQKVIRYFGKFLSYCAQFLFMYSAGYLFFFINSRFLVAKILKQKGLLMYILALLAAVAFLYPIIAQLLILLPINTVFGRDIFMNNPFIIENAFGAIAIMLLSLPIVLSLQWAKQNTTIISLEKEKSQTELDLLKQQLNPHFFFNTLNNLYGLSLQGSEQTSESILRLAELMRYVIYKGQEPRVKIVEELQYLEDYMELQKIRLKKPLRFAFEKEIEDEQIEISPLVLIVMVENAFKHGIEPAEDSAYLHLKIKCNSKQLYFLCKNSFEPSEKKTKPGIGIANLKSRLALLYPDYHLKISSVDGIFTTELNFSLI